MSDSDIEFSREGFTQTGSLSDPSLSQLRDQIKKIMIPLLIKTFQSKLELSQSLGSSSKLHSQKDQRPSEEIIHQLKMLDADLKVLLLWCQSCRTQVQKALSTPEEELKNTVTTAESVSNPAVTKSFSHAVSGHPPFLHTQLKAAGQPKAACPARPWWKKFIFKQKKQ